VSSLLSHLAGNSLATWNAIDSSHTISRHRLRAISASCHNGRVTRTTPKRPTRLPPRLAKIAFAATELAFTFVECFCGRLSSEALLLLSSRRWLLRSRESSSSRTPVVLKSRPSSICADRSARCSDRMIHRIFIIVDRSDASSGCLWRPLLSRAVQKGGESR